jgi:antitoxin component of MazEF toxin-antitoxin module
MKVQIRAQDGDMVVPLPQEVLHQMGWEDGTIVELSFDAIGIDLFVPPEINEEDFQRQLLFAKKAMRKYHIALRELGKT